MTTLQFVDTHNLIAFLTKSAKSEGFEQIVDFLNASSIKYALTVNPTIYTSCIEQFWSTVKAKMVNGEVQLQALVDGKKIVVTEASVRRDLQLEDANGVDCLPNATIFEQLTLMGAKTTAWNEFSSTMASAIICLANNQKFNFSKYIFESMMKNLDSAVKFLMYPRFVQVFLDNQLEGMINHNRIYIAPSHTKKVFANMKRKPKKKDTQIPQSNVPSDNLADEAINEENVSKHSNDLLLNCEDRLKLEELMTLCTNLQNRVLDLEHTKTTQALEIDSLKRRVKKLEKKQRSKTHGLKRLYKVGLSARVVSSEDEGLGEEDASKQGRKIHNIDADEDITLENVHDADMFGVHDLDGDEVFVETEEPVVNAARTTSTILVSAAKDLSNVDMTLAQALAELKSAKPKAVTNAATTTTTVVISPKAKRLVIQEQEQASTPITSSKDKDKEAIRLQAQFDEEERIAREKEEANVALIAQWNDIQDKVETDYELAQKLQAEEQEELTIKEKSKLFQQLLEERMKHFAAKRVEERRNRPPTKAQQRSIMVNTFVDMDTKLVGCSEVREEGSETREESSSKRAGDELEQEPSKKQKMEYDKETSKLQSMMEVIPDEEKVAVDAIPLATKPPSIVDWKIIKEGKIGYYQIIRADGNSKRYSSMIQMLKSIDREDLSRQGKISYYQNHKSYVEIQRGTHSMIQMLKILTWTIWEILDIVKAKEHGKIQDLEEERYDEKFEG
ncbi:hypothetical protein Tco_1377566 [Tanacetum coccineum]